VAGTVVLVCVGTCDTSVLAQAAVAALAREAPGVVPLPWPGLGALPAEQWAPLWEPGATRVCVHGCDLACLGGTLAHHGVRVDLAGTLAELGLERGGAPVTPENVQRVLAWLRRVAGR
jgi:uncharacterized metal-binding protein